MAVSIAEALEIIYTKSPLVSTEIIPIELCVGRIAAVDHIATFNLPRFHNSAMDGYAIKLSSQGKTVQCNDIIYAGDSKETILKENYVIKIMTGAPIPDGCEAVVPVENVEVNDKQITLPLGIKLDSNIRYSGEDIKSGESYIQKGEKLTSYSIALLASQGITHTTVYRKIKISVFGTGDELRSHYEKIEPHQLYNSNTPMFLARAKELGCHTEYIPNSGDTIEALKGTIASALSADIIITSGGISMGDKDFTKDAFSEIGMEMLFEKIDIKPGKPTTLGMINNTVIINLPGNPLASMVNYEIFVRAVIRKISGAADFYHKSIKAKMKDDFSQRKGKFTVRLGLFDGEYFAPIKSQLPGMVSPLKKANSMMITESDIEHIAKNADVKVIPIDWEFCGSEDENLFTS